MRSDRRAEHQFMIQRRDADAGATPHTGANVTTDGVLEGLAAGDPLAAVLDQLARWLESECGGFCSVLGVDGATLRLLAAPNLPVRYARSIDGLAIGPKAGGCGTAAYTKQRVIVPDVEKDALWADYREIARADGIRACWSEPVLAHDGKVLATVGLHFRECRFPAADELASLLRAARLASIALDRERTRAALQASETRYRLLIQHSPDLVHLCDQDGVILYASPSAEQVLGYTPEQLVGRQSRDFVHPDDLPQANDAGARTLDALANGPVLLLRIRHRDGTWRSLEVAARSFLEGDGRRMLIVHSRDSTERVRTEAALREREALYRTLTETSPSIIGLIREGRILYANAAAARACGCETGEALVGVSVADLVHPEDRALALSRMREAMAGRDLGRVEIRLLRPAGATREVEVSGRQVPYQGAPALLFVGHDVTDHREAERALTESEHLFTQLVQNLPQVFWMSSVDKQELLYVSDMYEHVWGRSRLDLVMKPLDFLEGVHPDDRERVRAALPRQARGEYDVEYRVVRPDGSVRWIRDRAFPIRNGSGHVHRVAGIAEDVTDARRRDDDIRLLAGAISQAAEGVIITDATGAIEYVNPAFEHITGYSRREVRGKNPRFLKSGVQDAAFYAQMWNTLLDGQAWRARFVNRRKDGRQYTQESLITPVRGGDGRISHFIAVVRDVTRELSLEDQLRQAQKMEAVGRLAGGIAHDFNNVLSIIMGSAQFALDALDESHAARADLHEVLHASQRAARLTRQLLTFSKQQITQPRVLQLRDIFDGTKKMLCRIIPEDIELCVDVANDLWHVTADPTSIEQVLFNLVINSRDAMPRGGRITVDAANMEAQDGMLQGATEPMSAGRYVRLRVSDTGMGMDAATRDRIFEPFFTTKSERGTGLGLSIVFGIVKQSGGYIRVESEAGAGSTFEVYLPATDSPEAPQPVTVPAPGGGQASGTILLVEDQAGVRATVRRMLAGLGWRVVEAEHGEEALAVWRAHRADIRLVLSDVVMPRQGGHELARHIRAVDATVPILLMTGYADLEIPVSDLLAASVQLIEKPFQAAVLQQRIHELLHSGGTAAAPR